MWFISKKELIKLSFPCLKITTVNTLKYEMFSGEIDRQAKTQSYRDWLFIKMEVLLGVACSANFHFMYREITFCVIMFTHKIFYILPSESMHSCCSVLFLFNTHPIHNSEYCMITSQRDFCLGRLPCSWGSSREFPRNAWIFLPSVTSLSSCASVWLFLLCLLRVCQIPF